MEIPVGEVVGSVGGGALLEHNPQELRAVKFELPMGDETVVQLARGNDAQNEKDPKTTTATLYQILRDLESTCVNQIRLS